MKRFDIIEHTADTGIVAYGADFKEALVNAAYAMFSLMIDLEDVREEVCRQVEVEAPDEESLVVAWLNELIYAFEVDRTIFSRFEILELDETSLQAEAYGEQIDASRHDFQAGVKAATYHMLKVDKNDEYSIRVIFDT